MKNVKTKKSVRVKGSKYTEKLKIKWDKLR